MLQYDLTKYWKNYRTWLNEHAAVISVNMAMLDCDSRSRQLAYVVRAYAATEEGLPLPEQQTEIFRHILHTVNLLSALPEVQYAGHILSNGQSQLCFYFNDQQAFLETLEQLQYDDLILQQDENWDTFFDFLLPTPLEEKMSLTEEMLDSLAENGVDLAQPQIVEHHFHFLDRDDIERFVEKCSLSAIPFNVVRYTENAVPVAEDMLRYVVKLEQEILLNTQDIFSSVEQLDQLAQQFSAFYIGWEYAAANPRNYLN